MNKRSHIFKRFFALFTITAVLLTALPGHMKAAGYFHDVFDIEVTVRQESYGLLDAVKSGEIAGKTETGKRLLSLKIDVTRFGRSFENCMSYCTYSDRSGWSGWVSAGGTAGENKSGDYISGVRIDLTGVFGELYDVYYRSYVSGIGWLSWAKNGEDSGVLFGDVGIEAVHVILCKKQVAYAPVMGGCTAISEATLDMLHCEAINEDGETVQAKNGEVLGNPSEGKFLSIFSAKLLRKSGMFSGDICYRVCFEEEGWQKECAGGRYTEPKDKEHKLCAVSMTLQGEIADYCDVYYRVYIQTFGWLSWAKNGAYAGSEEIGKRVKAVEARLVAKGATPPEGYGGFSYLTADDVCEIDVPYICQNPELPQGCESVALTMVLNYYGYSLKKTEIVDKYLIYDDNYMIGFRGTPFGSPGGCIYSPGLTNTANVFLKKQNSKLRAYNLLGTNAYELFTYVANGSPVLVWTTIDYQKASFNGVEMEYAGKTYGMASNLHCTVLKGYDTNKQTVTLLDPITGEKTLNIDTFIEIYDSMYQQAVVIY